MIKQIEKFERVKKYGLIERKYRKVVDGKVKNDVV